MKWHSRSVNFIINYFLTKINIRMGYLKATIMLIALCPIRSYGQLDEYSRDILKMQEINGSAANFNIVYEQLK
jgi:hypothetical protein